MCLALGQACTLDPALCLSSSCGALLVVMSSMLSQSQSTTNVRTAVLSAIGLSYIQHSHREANMSLVRIAGTHFPILTVLET